jgi:hypothetical protein
LRPRHLCSALAVVALLCGAWRVATSSEGGSAAAAPPPSVVAARLAPNEPPAPAGARAVPYAPPAAGEADATYDDPDLALDQEGEVVVAARAVAGAAAWNLVAVALDRAAETVLRVDRGLTAAVRLFDVDGAPYAGPARVRKVLAEEERPETGERGAALTEAFRETTPRALRDGSAYLLHGLRPGESFTLLAAAPEREPSFFDHAAPESGPDPFPLEARLGPRHAFVSLEAAPPGNAPAGLSFALRDTGGADVVAAGADDRPTQASPRFRHPVPAGVGSVLRVDAYAGDGPFAAAEVEVPPLQPGETFEAGRLPLEPLRAVVAGRVMDADDRPVAGATVEALPRRGPPLAGTADAAGAFSLRGLPGRGPYQVAAHAEGRVAALAADVPEGAADLRFALETAGAVEGRVRAPAGVDAARLRVRAMRADRGPVATVVEAGGAFRLTGLPAGVYVLVVDGPGVETLRVGDVVVAAGETNREDRLQRLAPRLSPRGEP